MTYLHDKQGKKIAYSKMAGKDPGIIFLSGFRSDMTGTKATYLESQCRKSGNAFIRFDYFGHGISDGKFEEGTLSIWLDNVLQIIDELTEGPQILVGSSMGGWLMLLAALARPERVHALVGIAAAPDFLEDFDRLSPEQHASLEKTGMCYVPSGIEGQPYAISANLLSDAKKHYLLHSDIAIDCPIRLLQGMQDKDVPWKKAIKIADRVVSKDVQVQLIKEGDHRLSSPEQLEMLGETVRKLSKI